MNAPIADMLTRIRNSQLRGTSVVSSPASKLRAWVLDFLKDEGYIRGYEKITDEKVFSILQISLKYYEGSPVIRELKRVSKPGRRIFSRAESLPKINNGLGIAIISTPKGVMTDVEARKQKVGGEIICKVF